MKSATATEARVTCAENLQPLTCATDHSPEGESERQCSTMKVSFTPLQNGPGYNLDKLFQKEDVFVEVNPGGVVLPKRFCEMSEQILNMPVRKDDIWLLSYPRTGSTWAQEIIWLLANNLDFEGSKREMQATRSPLLELSALFHDDHKDFLKQTAFAESVQRIHDMPSPRFIKSHLPWQLLPTQLSTVKPKIVYTARNPKDLCVSFFYYCQLIHGFAGSFEDFCEIFLDNKAPIGAFFPHLLTYWNKRHEENFLFLMYEDMKRDLPGTIRKLASFLGVEDIATPENVNLIHEHVQFENMQKNPSVNLEPVLKIKQIDSSKTKFIRKGQIGDWKNYMSEEMSQRFDKWAEQELEGTDLKFTYE